MFTDQVIAEYDNADRITAQYTHGAGLGADVRSVICAESESGARWYSHNGRGDVVGIADESGASLVRYRYDAFGNLIDNDGCAGNSILFSGKRFDADIGLYYFGARWYDASLGRFISRDPLGYIDGPNEYVLAGGNPLLWVDPWGLSSRFAASSGMFMVAGSLAAAPEPVATKISSVTVASAAAAIATFGLIYTYHDEIAQAVSYGYNSAKDFLTSFPTYSNPLSYESVPGQIEKPYYPVTTGQSINISDITTSYPAYHNSTYIESVPVQSINQGSNIDYSNSKRETGQYNPYPKKLQGFPDAMPRKSIEGRKTWELPNGDILTWDSRHGAVEQFNKQCVNKGKFDPETGEQKRAPDNSRRLYL